MNDLSELRNFGRDLDEEIPGPSAELRLRVLTAFAEPPRRPLHGLSRRVAIAGGLGIALAAGLVIAPTLPWWDGAAAIDAQAAQILDRAALAAGRQPALTARPSQFVFIEEFVEWAAVSISPSGKPIVTLNPQLSETWVSASGARRGMTRSQPRSRPLPGHPTGPWHTVRPAKAPHMPAYLPAVPTSAEAMVRYLYQNPYGKTLSDQEAFVAAGDLIRHQYLRPAAQAAVFEAVARIPEVKVVHGAVTVDGTRGIAVQRIFQGFSYQMIFNSRTYAFIGERQVVAGAPHLMLKPGTVMYASTLLRIAIVDHAGQLPAG
jgi:hypothetical protein